MSVRDNLNSGKQIILLGTQNSFNLTSYAGWQNFTENDFIVECISGTGSASSNQYYGTSVLSSCTFYPSKSYDATTGILSVSPYIGNHVEWDGSESGNFNKNISVTHKVYLIK